MLPLRIASRLLALVGLVAIGCVHTPSSRPGPVEDGEEECDGLGSQGALPEARVPGRPLTKTEYANTVRDLLGLDDFRVEELLPRDDHGQGLTAEPAALAISPLLAEAYANAAETLSAAAVARLPRIVSCPPGLGEPACARRFVAGFGARAYRRPLTAAEETDLMRLYEGGRRGGDFARGVRMVIRAVLQSPKFLYHIRDGSPHDVAARLSYFLWRTMPDDELRALAASGRLRSRREVAARARAMLADPRARAAVTGFYELWLGLDELAMTSKDAERYPFSPAVRAAMKAETRAFVEHVFWAAGGSLDALLAAPVGFVDRATARLYRVPAPDGPGVHRVDFDSSRRAGILTQLAFLTIYSKPNQSSPVHRGMFVRERLLCTTLPDPPPNLVVFAPDPKRDVSTRERFDDHTLDVGCARCHRLMDPIGFGFEHYDEVGRWRDQDGGRPVDASGEIVGSRDADGEFDGAPALARILARSDQVHDCVVSTWFRHAVGRMETAADACSLRRVKRAFVESGRDLRELIVALTQTGPFMATRPEGVR